MEQLSFVVSFAEQTVALACPHLRKEKEELCYKIHFKDEVTCHHRVTNATSHR